MNAAGAGAFQGALPHSFAQLLHSCSVFVDTLLALELFNLLPVVPVVFSWSSLNFLAPNRRWHLSRLYVATSEGRHPSARQSLQTKGVV